MKEVYNKNVIHFNDILDKYKDDFKKIVYRLLNTCPSAVEDEEFDCNVIATLMPAQKQTLVDEGHDAFLEDFFVDVFNEYDNEEITHMLTEDAKSELKYYLIQVEKEKEYETK